MRERERRGSEKRAYEEEGRKGGMDEREREREKVRDMHFHF